MVVFSIMPIKLRLVLVTALFTITFVQLFNRLSALRAVQNTYQRFQLGLVAHCVLSSPVKPALSTTKYNPIHHINIIVIFYTPIS
jgi:hypothetical protein